MPPHGPRSGRPRPEAEDVNARIRRLMDEPATESRTARYALLLAEWAAVTRDSGEGEPRAA
ncbi:hypothetical protein ACKI16_29280 [Streptomyces scabiei]|uniref:hypothetical protein n=1 Tax=Streptomyces scabiei TaxID=1930 RepID=UPI0038F60D33